MKINKKEYLELVSKEKETFEDEFKADYNSPKLMWHNLIKDIISSWVSVDDRLPESRQVVIICFEYELKGVIHQKQTMATYVSYMTVLASDFMEDDQIFDCDYNKEEDEYYTPKGFYEFQYAADIHYLVNEKVTHWMPLMDLPNIK